MSEQEIEKQIQDKGLDAPRLTPELIDASIKGFQPVPTVELVREFHQTFGHPTPTTIDTQDQKTRELRVSLIAEELLELCDGLGLILTIANTEPLNGPIVTIKQNPNRAEVDMVEVADALADLDYVVAGANVVFGLPAERIINEVHASNMSKLGEDGKPIYREDGKILKGPNYWKPDIVSILAD